jgi:hypothetical protein
MFGCMFDVERPISEPLALCVMRMMMMEVYDSTADMGWALGPSTTYCGLASSFCDACPAMMNDVDYLPMAKPVCK